MSFFSDSNGVLWEAVETPAGVVARPIDGVKLADENKRLLARIALLEAENERLWADAGRWCFCVIAREFPVYQHLPGENAWAQWSQGERFQASTPEKALDAARAALEGKP